MATMNFDEIKALVDAIASGEKHPNMPIGIITDDMNKVREYLETVAGAKRINNILIAGAAQYFNDEGKLVEDIANREQQLADGTKCNAKKYLESRAVEYAEESYTLLYDVCYAYTAKMASVSRYIARKARKPLIYILNPTFAGMELIEVKD